ncbi:MAG TPA: hypothetical protein VIU37_05680 [Candidatus Limnocylindrales bacterium]
MPTLLYKGPIDEVFLVGVGVLKNGDTFDVPDAVAGRAPAAATDEAPADLGEGLLAQSDNYELAPAKAPKAPKGGE